MKNWISFNLADTILYYHQEFIKSTFLSRSKWCIVFSLKIKKKKIDKPALKSELSHLANSYIHNYKPSRSALRKHGILKKLMNDMSIVILRPDKGNGVVV